MALPTLVCVCLMALHGLRPVFRKMPEICEAGGIGGTSKAIAMVDMPTGIAGQDGSTR